MRNLFSKFGDIVMTTAWLSATLQTNSLNNHHSETQPHSVADCASSLAYTFVPSLPLHENHSRTHTIFPRSFFSLSSSASPTQALYPALINRLFAAPEIDWWPICNFDDDGGGNILFLSQRFLININILLMFTYLFIAKIMLVLSLHVSPVFTYYINFANIILQKIMDVVIAFM